ncbi:hypothetical protein J5N97_003000 [Dioscorea zingiberensis]|uniref:Uncharacterized protein n=1 Tax=Dioscorea zingiberensis TaxID=325984 RepID=A0A9D5D4S8_9LILI|nr:hypothetical protein J5N97_003000 [Dioscorea zingiberensis]
MSRADLLQNCDLPQCIKIFSPSMFEDCDKKMKESMSTTLPRNIAQPIPDKKIDMVIAISTSTEPLQAHPTEVLSTPAFNVIAATTFSIVCLQQGQSFTCSFSLPLAPRILRIGQGVLEFHVPLTRYEGVVLTWHLVHVSVEQTGHSKDPVAASLGSNPVDRMGSLELGKTDRFPGLAATNAPKEALNSSSSLSVASRCLRSTSNMGSLQPSLVQQIGKPSWYFITDSNWSIKHAWQKHDHRIQACMVPPARDKHIGHANSSDSCPIILPSLSRY